MHQYASIEHRFSCWFSLHWGGGGKKPGWVGDSGVFRLNDSRGRNERRWNRCKSIPQSRLEDDRRARHLHRFSRKLKKKKKYRELEFLPARKEWEKREWRLHWELRRRRMNPIGALCPLFYSIICFLSFLFRYSYRFFWLTPKLHTFSSYLSPVCSSRSKAEPKTNKWISSSRTRTTTSSKHKQAGDGHANTTALVLIE